MMMMILILMMKFQLRETLSKLLKLLQKEGKRREVETPREKLVVLFVVQCHDQGQLLFVKICYFCMTFFTSRSYPV